MDSETGDMLLAPTIGALSEPPRRVLDRLREAAFRAVQLSATQPGMRARELDGSARRDLAATLRRNELFIAGIDLWIPVEHFTDGTHADRAVSATLATIELAADLGRGPVSMMLPGADAAAVIESLASHAERFGVTIADHNDPPANGPGIGAGLDPAAVIGRGESPAKVAAVMGDSLASARLCDLLRSGMRGPVGEPQEGRLDVMAYRAALSVVGYGRPVVLDARQWPDPWVGLLRSREAWDACALM